MLPMPQLFLPCNVSAQLLNSLKTAFCGSSWFGQKAKATVMFLEDRQECLFLDRPLVNAMKTVHLYGFADTISHRKLARDEWHCVYCTDTYFSLKWFWDALAYIRRYGQALLVGSACDKRCKGTNKLCCSEILMNKLLNPKCLILFCAVVQVIDFRKSASQRQRQQTCTTVRSQPLTIRCGQSQGAPSVTKKRTTGPPALPPINRNVSPKAHIFTPKIPTLRRVYVKCVSNSTEQNHVVQSWERCIITQFAVANRIFSHSRNGCSHCSLVMIGGSQTVT